MDTSQDVLKKTFYLSNGSEEQIFMNNLESHLLISSNGGGYICPWPREICQQIQVLGNFITGSQCGSTEVVITSQLRKGKTGSKLNRPPQEDTMTLFSLISLLISFHETIFMGKQKAEFLNAPWGSLNLESEKVSKEHSPFVSTQGQMPEPVVFESHTL